MLSLDREIKRANEWKSAKISGRVTHVIGMLIESTPFLASLGEIALIFGKEKTPIECQVVGFKENKVLLMALSEMKGLFSGAEVYPLGSHYQVALSFKLIGRVIDASGHPIDGQGPIESETYYPLRAAPPAPLKRKMISEPLITGIKAIDGLVTLAKGCRFGIFSGSGVGKSSLMGMIAKNVTADVNVIALIGERGREVREFIETALGIEGLKRSVVVVATSSEPAMVRVKGAYLATTIAEYFRDRGKEVMLMMDSITRFATALREIGLAIGEPPTTRGFPPSVFAALPCLLERSGLDDKGAITGLYTVLAEADNFHDPIVDQMRSLVDGHLFLSRELSNAQKFPPIDIVNSLSRVMGKIANNEQLKWAAEFRDLLFTYREAEELISVGAYVPGSDPKVDRSRAKMEAMNGFLQQQSNEKIAFEKTLKLLSETIK